MTGAGLGVVLFGCLGGLLNLSLQALTLCAHQNMQKVLVSYFGYGCQRTTSGYAIHCPREIWQVFFSPSLLARISHRLKVYQASWLAYQICLSWQKSLSSPGILDVCHQAWLPIHQPLFCQFWNSNISSNACKAICFINWAIYLASRTFL